MAGYSRLACLMASHQELGLFKQFGALNVKNLLLMQSELIYLEQELLGISVENLASQEPAERAFEFSFFDLKESAGSLSDGQWQKTLEVRERLKEYNEALLLYAQIQKLPRPCKNHLNILKEWLDRPEGGDFFLRGYEADIWENEKDIIILSDEQARRDSCTRLIGDKLAPLYHRYWSTKSKRKPMRDWDGLWHYDDSILVSFANASSTVLASLLPTSSILMLYFVTKPLAKVAAIMVFTTFFSLTLAFITRAKRIEVFAATTAFAAVQVVFIGGSGTPPPTSN